MLSGRTCFVGWLLLIAGVEQIHGDSLKPVESIVNVKETQTVTLEWLSDFPMSSDWYLHVRFKPPGATSFGQYPIATLVNNVPSKNQRTQTFHTKITTVTVTQQTSNSFSFKILISNMAITEEGEYKIERFSPSGNFGFIRSTIKAGVIVRPKIDKYPPDVTKREDQDVQLKCTITAGNPKPLTFKWYFTPLGSSNRRSVTDDIKAVHTSYYNMTKITYRSKGKYSCVVSNGFGESDTYDISLSVLHKPYIATPPLNTTVFESDGSKEMSCNAQGNPSKDIKYHWYKGTQQVEIKVSTANIIIVPDGSRLRFQNPKRELATLYSCAGENIYGIGESKGAYLVVTYIPEPVEFPELTNNIANVHEHHNVTIRCYSDAVPPATYIWYRKYRDFRGQLREQKVGEENKSGKMTLYNVKINQTGEYKCVAFNYPNKEKNQNQKYSKQAVMNLKVMYGPLRTNLTVNGFNHSNEVVEVGEDEQVIIQCVSHSEPPATYNIQYKNAQLNSDSKVGYVRIDKMTVDKDGDYFCIASNQNLGRKETRRIRILTAIKPTTVAPHPSDQTVSEGATVRLQCNVVGRPAPKVYWTKNGKNITNFNDGVFSKTYQITRKPLSMTDPVDKLFRISAVLIMTGVRESDEGIYQCISYNGAGRAIIRVQYTVNYAPKFLQPLQNYTVKVLTSDIVFTCSVRAKPDNNIFYRWFFNDKEISVIKSRLERNIAKREHTGRYRCEARNLVGARNSTVGTLLVTYPAKITYITPQRIVDPLDSITLSCSVDGVPKPSVTWSKKGDPNFKYFGEEMRLERIKIEDKGVYYCSAKNIDGGDEKDVSVLVKHKPLISTNSPADTKVGVDLGSLVTLVCQAEGYPVPDIFWKEKGSSANLVGGVGPYSIQEDVTVFGRRSKLKFRAETLGDSFICKAKNDEGSVEQEYNVLGKGPPDPPYKTHTPTDKLQAVFPITVNITLSWIPGFSGGYPVEYILYYREKNDFTARSYEQLMIGPVQENKYVFENRKPSTTYEFAMAARNKLGKSVLSQSLEFKTRDAPPAVADVTFTLGEDKTSIVVKWHITKDPVPAKRLRRNTGSVPLKWDYGLVRYQVVNTETWKEERISDIPRNGTYVVSDLDASESYSIYFVLYDTHEKFAPPVGIDEPIRLGDPQVAASSGLSQTDIIAIGVGCGGALLLLIIIILFVVIHKLNNTSRKKNYNDPRVQVDIPVNTLRSNYSADVVRTSYLNEDDPYGMDSTVVGEEKSPPPEYDGLHHYADPPLDYGDNVHRPSNYDPQEHTPSYTSFGRIPKKDKQVPPAYSSMNQLNTGSRAAEISRGNERHRYSLDNLDDYPEDSSRPLIQNNKRQNVRNSRGRLPSDGSLPQPAPFTKDALRNQPPDEGPVNRAPGAFGDRAQRFKKPPTKPHDQPPPPPPNGFHQGVNGRHSPPSSIASSKPYRSDNEYIDDQDDKYVGYLV